MSAAILIPAGMSIDNAAVRLVEAAKASPAGKAWATFNGVRIEARSDDRADEIVAAWSKESARKAAEWRASPEGRRQAREAEERVKALQEQHDRLVHELVSIDPADDVRTLDWFCRLQPCTDHVDVKVESETLVRVFEGAGFRAGANTGPAYRENDRNNSFRYLVGQALDGLTTGPAIHPILHKFVAEWKARFLPVSPAPGDGGGA